MVTRNPVGLHGHPIANIESRMMATGFLPGARRRDLNTEGGNQRLQNRPGRWWVGGIPPGQRPLPTPSPLRWRRFRSSLLLAIYSLFILPAERRGGAYQRRQCLLAVLCGGAPRRALQAAGPQPAGAVIGRGSWSSSLGGGYLAHPPIAMWWQVWRLHRLLLPLGALGRLALHGCPLLRILLRFLHLWSSSMLVSRSRLRLSHT